MPETVKKRRTSRGTCAVCGAEVGKAQMTRHLQTHQAEQEKAKGRHAKRFHLIVEGRYSPEYWLHLDVRTDATLDDLDSFLRGIWLECCGHLSAFEIGGTFYERTSRGFSGDESEEDEGEEEESEEEEEDFFQGLGMTFGMPVAKSMTITLAKALAPGIAFTYEYDFGSTTELKLRVMSEHAGTASPAPVLLLARNFPPEMLCEKCGEPAAWVAGDEEGEYHQFCKKCAKRGKLIEWKLPVVNSPRVGVCAYEG